MKEGRTKPPLPPSPGWVSRELCLLVYWEDRPPGPLLPGLGVSLTSAHSLAHLNSAEWDISEGLPCPSSTPESSALLRHGLGWSRLS